MTGLTILNTIGFVSCFVDRPCNKSFACLIPEFDQISGNILNVSGGHHYPIEFQRFTNDCYIYNRVLLTDMGSVVFYPESDNGPIKTKSEDAYAKHFEDGDIGKYAFGILEETLKKVILAPCANQVADITEEEDRQSITAEWQNWRGEDPDIRATEERLQQITVPVTDLNDSRNGRTLSQEVSYDDVMAYSLMNNWVGLSNNILRNTTLDTANNERTFRTVNQTLSSDLVFREAESAIRDNALNRVHTEQLVSEIHDRLETMFSRNMPQSVSDAVRLIASLAPRAEEGQSNTTTFVLDSLGPLEHAHSDGETTQRVSTPASSDPQSPQVNEDGSIQAIPY